MPMVHLRLYLLEQGRTLGVFSSVRRCQEFLHEDVTLEQPPLHQCRDSRIDHWRRAAQVSLVAGKAAIEMGVGRLMNIASEALPVRVFVGLAKRRYVGEIVVVAIQSLEQLPVVKLCQVSDCVTSRLLQYSN